MPPALRALFLSACASLLLLGALAAASQPQTSESDDAEPWNVVRNRSDRKSSHLDSRQSSQTSVSEYDDDESKKSRDRRDPKYRSSLSIAAFNAHFLFDYGSSSAAPWKSKAEADQHYKDVAEVLRIVNADVVVLSEVHNLAALEKLRSMMSKRMRASYKAYLVPGTDTTIGMNVGLLTRVDPVDDKVVRLFNVIPVQNDSDAPPTNVGVAKYFAAPIELRDAAGTLHRLVILGAHLISAKANANEPVPPALRREAQALIIKEEVEEWTALGYKCIIAGDMNDGDPIVKGRDGPTSSALEIMRSSANGMKNFMETTSSKERSEAVSTYYGTFVDHILIDKTITFLGSKIYTTLFKDVKGRRISDHYPVKTTISLQKATAVHQG